MRNQNPFRPGAGALPPLLAGRDPELSLATKRLDALAAGVPPPRGLLFFGPRGNGKTTLLVRIAEDAPRRGMRAANLSAGAFTSRRQLTRHLQEQAGLTRTRLRGAPAAGFGVAAEPASPTEEVDGLLRRWITGDPGPLVMRLDEAHTLEPKAGRLFFGAVQEATAVRLPFLLLVAGTPDAPRRLRRAGTFIERVLERVPVGRLARPDTRRALVEPADDAGRPMRADAAAFLASESQDYPYFIQLLGSAAWEAAASGEITMESARKGAAAAGREIERFYAERFGEAWEHEVSGALFPLAAFLSERGGSAGDLEFRRFLGGIGAPGPGAGQRLLTTLTDLGVVWRGAAGKWEMGIPSFADYLLRLEADDAARRG